MMTNIRAPTILDLIMNSDRNSNKDPNGNGLNMPQEYYQTSVGSFSLPDVEIHGTESKINKRGQVETYLNVGLSFDTNDAGTAMSESWKSYADSKIYLDVRKVAHDLTCIWTVGEDFSTINQLGDQEISLIKPLGLDSDGMTPDFVYFNDVLNEYYVVEFTTISHNTNSELPLRNAYLAKKEKYLHELTVRSNDRRVNYYVLVVSMDAVYTNLNIPDMVIKELITRLRTAQQIINVAVASNIEIPEDDGDAESQELKDKKKSMSDFFTWFNSQEKFQNTFVHKECSLEKLQRTRLANPNYVPSLITRLWQDAKIETLKNSDKIRDTLNDLEHSKVVLEHDQTLEEVKQKYIDDTVAAHANMITTETDTVFSPNAFRHKHDQKTVINLPLLCPKKRLKYSSDIKEFCREQGWEEQLNKAGDMPVAATCFYYAMKSARENQGIFEENPEEELLLAMEDLSLEKEKQLKKTRNKYRRVTIPIPSKMAEELAVYGVSGKSKKDSFVVKQQRKKSKLVMPLDTDITDIFGALNNCEDLFLSSPIPNPSPMDVKSLYTASLQNHFNNDTRTENVIHWTSRMESLLNSKMGLASTIISDLAMEISLSLKQNASNKRQFILKKLRRFDILILIKSTSYNGPMFFSLMWDINHFEDLNTGKVFRRFDKIGNLACTEFMSVKRDKLENWIRCESIFASMLAYWTEFYGKTALYHGASTEMKEYTNPSVFKMTLLSMMIQLENKERTEEICTKARYMFMEGFVNFPDYCRPHKMYTKLLSSPIRSRLQLFFIIQLFKAGRRMCETLGFRIAISELKTEEGGSNKVWLNMFNPYTEEHLSSPYQLVNLMYLGYLKDKNLQSERNVTYKLYEKILEWEEKKPDARTCMLGGDPHHHPRPHEYSGSLLLDVLDSADEQLSREYGRNYKDQINKEIYHVLANTDAEDLATLKASAAFTKEMQKEIVDILKQKGITKKLSSLTPKEVEKYLGPMQKRPKAIQSIVDMLKRSKGCSLSDLLYEAMNVLSEDECMRIDLFKKSQHGGLREIYVLHIAARLMQYVLEAMARVVCSLFKSETMMNPKSKSLIPLEHSKIATATFGEDHITVTDSADAEKWNQGHYVPKFAFMLKFFMPSEMHCFIDYSCHLFTKKRIMISPDVMKALFLPRVGFASSIFQMMSDCLVTGKTKTSWGKLGANYIQTETGMMQGILHYTSSLWHAIYLEYFKKIAHRILKHEFTQMKRTQRRHDNNQREQNDEPQLYDNPDEVPYDEKNEYIPPVIHNLESSDDSGIMASFQSLDKPIGTFFLFMVSAIFKLRHMLSIYLGIYPSIKKTLNAICAFEFNSEYFFATNHFRPTFRWVVASMMISEQECYTARQEECSSNLTAVLTGGGTFGLCSVIQWCQLLLHYRIFGMSVNPNFSVFSREVQRIKDPALGFFLVDNPFCPGLFGFRYNVWKALLQSPMSKLYNHMLTKHAKSKSESTGSAIDNIFEITKSGALTANSSLVVTNKEIWENTVKAMGLSLTWIDDINAKPEILYRRAKDNKEMLLKLTEKMHAPGVVQSLASYDSLNKIIASSVFALTRQCLTTKSLKVNDSKGKVSLLRLINWANECVANSEDLTQDQLTILVPQKTLYSDYARWVDGLRMVGHWLDTRLTKKNVTVHVDYTDDVNYINPESLVRSKWFGYRGPKFHRSVIERSWNNLKLMLPWLHDTDYNLSLAQSPFVNHVQLRNFLSRLDIKNRSVVISGVHAKAKYGVANYTSVIMNNFAPGFRLNYPYESEEDMPDEETSHHAVNHCLKMITEGPFTPEYKYKAALAILRNARTIVEDKRNPHSRMNKLFLLKKVAESTSEEHAIKEIINTIVSARLGVIGCFVKAQTYTDGRYTGKGVWNGYVDGKALSVVMEDQYIERVYVESGFNLQDLHKIMAKVFPQAQYRDPPLNPHDTILGYISGQMFSHRRLIAMCPVVLSRVEASKQQFSLDNIVGFDIQVTTHHVNLVAKVERRVQQTSSRPGAYVVPAMRRASGRETVNQDFPVMNYYFRDEDLYQCQRTDVNFLLRDSIDTVIEDDQVDKSPLICWIAMSSLTEGQLVGFLRTQILKDINRGVWDITELTKYLRSQTRTYLTGYKSVSKFDFLAATPDTYTYDPDRFHRILEYGMKGIEQGLEDLLTEGNVDFEEQIKQQGLNGPDAETGAFSVPDVLLDIKADFFDAGEESKQLASVAVKFFHPFLHPFLTAISRVTGSLVAFADKTNAGLLPMGLDHLKDVIEFLLAKELTIDQKPIIDADFVDLP